VTTLLHNALVTDARGEFPASWVLFDGDVIGATGNGPLPQADEVIDAEGGRLTPGFLDLHAHGGGGFSFEDGTDAISAALALHRAHGTTRSVISLVAAPVDELAGRLAGIAKLTAADALVLGSHLEGPFLSPSRRGAHSAEFLRSPDPRTIGALLDAARGTLRQLTLAPELPGALEAIDILTTAGCTVAIGHTEADAATAAAAFDRGARLVTHAFNAMPGVSSRAPGPVGAAIADDRVTVELILDGHHLHPQVASLLLSAAAGRIALVTDAMAGAGAPDGGYRLGPLDVTVQNGVAIVAGTAADRSPTLAGSTLTLDSALRRAVQQHCLEPADAVAAVTSTPARALGLDARFGLLAAGYAADAVLLDAEWRVQRVWADGGELFPA
jgi:N-acetylglucosamine-6-phosphate deacetylase